MGSQVKTSDSVTIWDYSEANRIQIGIRLWKDLLLVPIHSCEGDAPLNSLMDSVASPKKKTTEGEGVGVRSLACNISGVEGRVRALGWD